MPDEQNLNTTNNVGGVEKATNANVAVQDTSTASESSNNNVDDDIVVPSEPIKQERVYKKDEVKKIANAERQKAYDKARQDVLSELQQGSSTISDSELERRIDAIAAKKAEKARIDEFNNKIKDEAEQFMGKINAKIDTDSGSLAFEDPEVEESFKTLNLSQVSGIFAPILNSVDNPKDVLKDLGKHPEKWMNILSISQFLGAKAGMDAMKKLSDSLKVNQEAANVSRPPAPLRQESPSLVGINSGEMTVADFRKRSPRERRKLGLK